ncbi:MAG: DUF5723 family protein [Bacteroidota bacterium]
MKNFKILCFLLFAMIPFISSAQQELNTHFMRGLWQSTLTNPAMLPEAKVIVGLPSVYNELFVSDITYNDIVTTSAGETFIDLSTAIDQLSNENIIRDVPELRTLALGLRFDQLFVSLDHAIKGNLFAQYPKSLLEVLFEGNAQFIDQAVEIGPEIQASIHSELSLGLGYQINPNFSIGGRVRLLTGIADLSTTRNSMQLYTSPDIYQLELRSNYQFNTYNLATYDGFDDFNLNDEFLENLGEIGTQNTSIGFDFGIYYQTDLFDVSFSVLDIGKLNWDSGVTNYTLEGISDFDGVNISDLLFDDDINIYLNDTLRNVFDVVETQNSYSSSIGTKLLLSGTYKISPIFRAGGMVMVENFRDEWFPAVGVNLQGRPNEFIEFGFLYAYRAERFDNLGLNLGLKLGPVQIIASTDNVLSAANLSNANSANIRLGLNVAVGSVRGNRGVDPDNISNQDDFFN